MKKAASQQRTASSVGDLEASYDRLYTEWLGEHRTLREAALMLEHLQVQSGRLLDVACGMGYMMDRAERRGATSFGLDISRVALLKARALAPSCRVTRGNGEQLPFPDECFDYVTCVGSLEHFIHPQVGVQEIARVLKSSGRAAVMLPNSHHMLAIYNVYRTGGILSELQDYERFATRIEWQSLLEENGLRVLSVYKFNVGFARAFRKGREGFWFVFNALYRLFGDRWIPLNLSFGLGFVCSKSQSASIRERPV